jgi:hypothetical protein
MQQPYVGQGHLIFEVSRSHTMTHHTRYDTSGLVIYLSQRPVPDNVQYTKETDIHTPRGIQTCNPSK